MRDEPWRLKILSTNSGAAPLRLNGSARGDTAHTNTQKKKHRRLDLCTDTYTLTYKEACLHSCTRCLSLSVTHTQQFAEEQPMASDFCRWGRNPSDYLIGLRMDLTGFSVCMCVCVCSGTSMFVRTVQVLDLSQPVVQKLIWHLDFKV